MRLDRYLAESGLGTRKEVRQLLKQGRVLVSKEMIKDPGFKLEAAGTEVLLDGKKINYTQYEYYMLNKPAGLVSESRVRSLRRGEQIPEGSEQFVVDLIRNTGKTDLFPVGRLDKDTEGLLLITNDGKLSFRLLSPRFHVEKVYYVKLKKPLPGEDADRITAGIDIGDELPTKPCRLVCLEAGSCLITLTEGRYHQVKRMFEAVGNEVIYLKRTSFGPLQLDENLGLGEYRRLTEEEVELLKQAAGQV